MTNNTRHYHSYIFCCGTNNNIIMDMDMDIDMDTADGHT